MKSIAKFFFLGVRTVAGTGVYSPQVLIISHISIYANKEWEPEKETSGMIKKKRAHAHATGKVFIMY